MALRDIDPIVSMLSIAQIRLGTLLDGKLIVQPIGWKL